jgi:hypothetical protein
MLDIIQHSFQDTIAGLLYRGSMEILFIELGILDPFHLIDLDYLSINTTDSLVKSTWHFFMDQ